jgi:predicted dehydrogenase
MKKTTRRTFLGAAAGTFFIPARILYGQELPRKQLRLAVVGAGGIGGMTSSELRKAGATVVALCDVNSARLAGAARHYPGIPTYMDWRELFKHHKDFDAVAVCTPDHTHAIIGLNAMRLGKHVYIQKPLAHSYEECKMLLAEQKRTGVVAQMGNQHHPRGKAFRILAETGIIGEVTEVVCWTDRPGRFWPPAPKSYPATGAFDHGFTAESWDVWLGPGPAHPCSPLIAPFKWRGWWDYGTGAIGDMAIHNADPAFEIFGWNAPISVKGICDEPVVASFPGRAKIEMTFAPTPKSPRTVKFTWMHSSQTPPLPKGVHPKYTFGDNGLMFVGTKGIFNGVVWGGGSPIVIAATDHEWNEETKNMQREGAKAIRGLEFHNHYVEFVNAAKAGTPEACASKMSYAAPFTQSLLVGAIGLRFPNRELHFDPAAGRFTDCPEANEFLKAPSRGAFSMKDFA